MDGGGAYEPLERDGSSPPPRSARSRQLTTPSTPAGAATRTSASARADVPAPEPEPGSYEPLSARTDGLDIEHGSLAYAVTNLGGEAPPLDAALEELQRSQAVEEEAAAELAALAQEASKLVTPVKSARSRAGATSPDQVPAPVWGHGFRQWWCGDSASARWARLIGQLTKLAGGGVFCAVLGLTATCSTTAPALQIPAAMLSGGAAIFWIAIVFVGTENVKLKKLAGVCVLVAAAVAVFFALLGWGTALLLLQPPGSANITASAPREAVLQLYPDRECVSAETFQLLASLNLVLHTLAGVMAVLDIVLFLFSIVCASTLVEDAVLDCSAAIIRLPSELDGDEKRQWRMVETAQEAATFSPEQWEDKVVLPIMRLTRLTLPSLSAWGPAIGAMLIGTWCVWLGALPVAVATGGNPFAVALLCLAVSPLVEAVPVAIVSESCKRMLTSLNHLRLEGRGANAERVRNLYDYLRALNDEQGPGFLLFGTVLNTRRLAKAALGLVGATSTVWPLLNRFAGGPEAGG